MWGDGEGALGVRKEDIDVSIGEVLRVGAGFSDPLFRREESSKHSVSELKMLVFQSELCGEGCDTVFG